MKRTHRRYRRRCQIKPREEIQTDIFDRRRHSNANQIGGERRKETKCNTIKMAAAGTDVLSAALDYLTINELATAPNCCREWNNEIYTKDRYWLSAHRKVKFDWFSPSDYDDDVQIINVSTFSSSSVFLLPLHVRSVFLLSVMSIGAETNRLLSYLILLLLFEHVE